MTVSKEAVQEAYPVEVGVVNVLILGEATETFGGTLQQVIPYIQAGYSHVVRDNYLDTWVATEPLQFTARDIADIKRAVSPGTYVTLENDTKVSVYTVCLEEDM
jgi:hypothetical protein